jgi:serine/threonine protein kinase
MLRKPGGGKLELMLAESRNYLALKPNANIVTCFGISETHASTMAIFELCDNGNLRDYIRKFRESHDNTTHTSTEPSSAIGLPQQNSSSAHVSVPSLSILMGLAEDIAHGMTFLHQSGCVHSDLSARTVLVTADQHCKLFDFGINRRHYDG